MAARVTEAPYSGASSVAALYLALGLFVGVRLPYLVLAQGTQGTRRQP